jgi:amino acid transporter
MIPTYLFTGTLLIVIGVGAYHAITTGGHPQPLTQLPSVPAATTMVSLWLLLKVFSSGCTAMTGVEAVSNGVMAFRDDTRKNAKITLTIIIALLAVLLLGIAFLCRAYGISATDPEGTHYESVLSMLTRAVMGHNVFYYVTIAAVLLVLALSANTAFADFPRLTRAIAIDDYMPHVFLLRGRRLLYSWGIYVLVVLTAILLIIFGGVTDRLIPLYAIGAFMAFTLSQSGMVMHWKRQGNAGLRMSVNALGAVATGITTLVVLVAKFVEGAWVTALLIALMILLMRAVKTHYVHVQKDTELDRPSCRLRSRNRSSSCPSIAGAALPRKLFASPSACRMIFAASTSRSPMSSTLFARIGNAMSRSLCVQRANAFRSSRFCARRIATCSHRSSTTSSRSRRNRTFTRSACWFRSSWSSTGGKTCCTIAAPIC